MKSAFAALFLLTLVLIENSQTLKAADLSDVPIPQKLMGIEIETSVLKIMSPTRT